MLDRLPHDVLFLITQRVSSRVPQHLDGYLTDLDSRQVRS